MDPVAQELPGNAVEHFKRVMQDVTEFAQIYMTQPDAKQLLQSRFGHTYWNYLLLKK